MAAFTRQDAVITALLTIFDAATEHPVDDGYIVAADDGDGIRVIVGGDGLPDDGELTDAASAEQRPATFENDPADEAGEVQCAIRGESGDDDDGALARQRAATITVVQALDAAIRADRTLGGVVANAWIPAVTTLQTRARGATVIRQFTVAYQALQS